MSDLPDPPKSSQRSAILQIALIVVAVTAISSWNSRRQPTPGIVAPEVAAPVNHENTLVNMTSEEDKAFIDRAVAKGNERRREASTGSLERQEFIRSCLASLTQGEEPAVMSVSPAEREAMCNAMYTAQ